MLRGPPAIRTVRGGMADIGISWSPNPCQMTLCCHGAGDARSPCGKLSFTTRCCWVCLSTTRCSCTASAKAPSVLGRSSKKRSSAACGCAFPPMRRMRCAAAIIRIPVQPRHGISTSICRPEHRNGLGFARLWDEANNLLRQRGVAVSWSRISAFNPGSLASHKRLGAKIVGSATFLKIGMAQFMIASGPPYLHCSLSKKDVPSLVLLETGPQRLTPML